MNVNNAVLVFVKYHKPGRVKTRLKPELSDEECVTLYNAMVNDLVKNIRDQEDFDVIFFFTPTNSKRDFQNWLGEGLQLIPQAQGDLGHKMNEALRWALQNNYEKTVLIGADIPTIEQSLLSKAFSELDHSAIVLGPSDDGGYYLIGTKKPQPKIFDGVNWSTELVLSETLEKISQNNLTVSMLSERSDIDTYSDVTKLFQLLETSKNGYVDLMPETYEALRYIIKEEKGNL